MDLDLERRAAAAFDRVFGLSGESLTVALHQECGDDASLRARVEELLRAAEREAFFLDGNFATPGDLNTPPVGGTEEWGGESGDALPARIGDCEILGVLGTGGMGIVYEGRQDQPRRPVAIKVVRAPGVTRAGLARFRQEAELLGRLDHPGIAKVFSVGIHKTPAGDFPFLVMELIPGATPITQHAQSRRLSWHQRLEMLADACDAVQAAHTALIVHRDLKPANILVGADGRVRVIDFGIAKSLSPDAGLPTIPTEGSRVVGTVHYMSPELLTRGATAASTQSDVFSLGVSMHELLLGTRPFGDDQTTMFEVMRRITTATAPPDSKAFRGLNPDLRTILGKAIAPDPRHRYATARDLADDIRNFLARRPIAARPQSRAYLAAMFVRRHRVATALSTIAVLALITLTVYSVAAGIGEKNARILADDRAVAASKELYRALMGSAARAIEDGDTATAVKQLRVAPEEWRGREHALLTAMVSSASRVVKTGSSIESLAIAADGSVRFVSRLGTGEWNDRGIETTQLIPLPQGGGPPPRLVHHSTDPELKIVAHEAPSAMETARLIFERAGQAAQTLNGTITRLMASAIDPSGQLLAISGPAMAIDGRTVVIDTVRGEVTGSIDRMGAVVFSPDGSTLWIAGMGLSRLDLRTGIAEHDLADGLEGRCESIAISADGARLAVRSTVAVHVFDPIGLSLVREIRSVGSGPIALDETGRWLAIADGQVVTLIETDTGAVAERLRSPTSTPVAIACSSVHDRLVAAESDGTLHSWDSLMTRIEDQRRVSEQFGVSADGSVIWTISAEPEDSPELRLLSTRAAGEGHTVPVTKAPTIAALSKDGRWLAWSESDGRLMLRAPDGAVRTVPPDGAMAISHLAGFGSDEPLIACCVSAYGRDPEWRIIQSGDAAQTVYSGPADGLIDLRETPDGGLLAVFVDRLEVFNPMGHRASEIKLPEMPFLARNTPDSQTIAALFVDGGISVISALTGAEAWRLASGWSGPEVLAMSIESPDRITLIRSDGVLGVWDRAFGDEPIMTISLVEPSERPRAAEVSRDGVIFLGLAGGGLRVHGRPED